MKKLAILLLVVVLSACSTPAAPTEQAVAPEPVVVTVMVVPTDVPAQPAPAEPVVVTVVVEATQVPAAVAPPPAAVDSNAPIALDNTLGRGVFTDMTMSSSNFTLRCFPRDITFNITTSNRTIKDVLFWYRIVDHDRLYPTEWKNNGSMVDNGNGNFTLTFSGEDVHPDLRLDDSWFDFQFIGLAKSGDVVDRSQKIESLVTYTFDCP